MMAGIWLLTPLQPTFASSAAASVQTSPSLGGNHVHQRFTLPRPGACRPSHRLKALVKALLVAGQHHGHPLHRQGRVAQILSGRLLARRSSSICQVRPCWLNRRCSVRADWFIIFASRCTDTLPSGNTRNKEALQPDQIAWLRAAPATPACHPAAQTQLRVPHGNLHVRRGSLPAYGCCQTPPGRQRPRSGPANLGWPRAQN